MKMPSSIAMAIVYADYHYLSWLTMIGKINFEVFDIRCLFAPLAFNGIDPPSYNTLAGGIGQGRFLCNESFLI
jgi:hypothetical protein